MNSMQQEKRLFIIVGFVITCAVVGLIISLILLHNRNDEVADNAENISKKEEKKILEKNVSGIVEYAFSEDSLQYTTQVAFREVEGNQKECIVVKLENIDDWNQLSREKHAEIVKGLVNTSRLQIDKEFGCVIIENLNTVLIEGFWRDADGYVIIEK